VVFKPIYCKFHLKTKKSCRQIFCNICKLKIPALIIKLIIYIFIQSYRNANTWNYIMGHFLFIFTISLYNCYVMIRASIQYPDWMANGAVTDLFTIPRIETVFFVNGAIIFMAICSYIFVGIIITCKISQ
jgi:hypothetical protein